MGPYIDDAGQTMPAALLRGAEALLCELPPANFDDFDRLAWIQLTSAGYAQVLDLPVLERGIRVTNGTGNFDVPIAEWSCLMILTWHRRLLELLDNQKKKAWRPDEQFQHELRGATVGIYGYGGIGRETARLAKALGLDVRVLTRNGQVGARRMNYRVPGTGDPEGTLPDQVFGSDRAEAFFRGLDYLVIAIPLTPATRGIIGAEQLGWLKTSAVLLNPARAAVVEEEALVRCLAEGRIRGASLDTHYAYPLPDDHPLWKLPNVILTPHISGHNDTPLFVDRFLDISIENLKRYLAGDPLLNQLSESQLRGE